MKKNKGKFERGNTVAMTAAKNFVRWMLVDCVCGKVVKHPISYVQWDYFHYWHEDEPDGHGTRRIFYLQGKMVLCRNDSIRPFPVTAAYCSFTSGLKGNDRYDWYPQWIRIAFTSPDGELVWQEGHGHWVGVLKDDDSYRRNLELVIKHDGEEAA